MSTGSDIAGAMGNVKTLPIPSEQRQDVFVAGVLGLDVLARWVSQAGKTSFWFPNNCKDPAGFCGVVLFSEVSDLLAPFYARAGNETNAFQWQPIEQNFVRRDQRWFNERKTA